MNELQALKQALDEWIAEDPTGRRYRILLPADISRLLERAQEIKAGAREQMLSRMGV